MASSESKHEEHDHAHGDHGHDAGHHADTHATVGHGDGHGGGHGDGHGSSPIDGDMVVMTWLVFGALFGVLYKFAFKPIMAGLTQREDTIRQALDDAEKTRAELESIEQTREELIGKAEDEAKVILADARKAADEAAHTIKSKATKEAQILVENAQREVSEAENRARAGLRKESADLAIALSSKILGENLDNERSRALADNLIDGMQ